MNRRSSNIAVLSTLMIVISSNARSQETALWSGQAQCRLSVQSPAYVDQEIQTWAITGQPQIQGQLQIYPGTWSVTGQGQRQDVQGTQTTTMRWSTNVPPMQAPLAIVVNSANQLIIKSYHAQMRVNNATTGSRQVSLFGIPQNPSAVAFTEFEYQFPSIQDFATSNNVTGSSSDALNGGIGPMQPPGLKGTAACQWQFVNGGPATTPSQIAPANLTPIAKASILPPPFHVIRDPPSAPSAFKAQPLDLGAVQLTWQAVTGATKYHLTGSGLPSAGLDVSATANNATVQNVPPGPDAWTITTVYPNTPANVNLTASATAMVRYVPTHSAQWLSEANGPGNAALALAHYLSLCGGQCLPGANFKDVMQALGLQLGTLAPNPPSTSGCGDTPWCGGWGSAWTDDQAARYTNVTEFENSARVTGCWTIGRPNGRIICYTKTMDHGLQVIVRQTDVSWFLSFAAGDPNAEVFDWVTYDGNQLYRTPFDQRLISAYTLTNGVMLDSEGTKYPPHACLACHGGKITASGVTGATLLPLDPGLLQNFDTGNSRRLNVVVFYASPSAAVARYLTGLYGSDPVVASSTGDPNYVPQGWKQQPEVYNNVVKPYCMMCHLATPSNLDFTIPANFYQNQDLVYTVTCSARSMPHAEAPFKQFWTKDTGPIFLPGYVAALLGHQSCP
jgi:hypothetical protein